ncbi:ZYBA0S08-00760g1_1 [Zygosaccharomyces bailii CLIB 213]|uniref:Spindle pole body component 110 n=1 Tax=Zygosaccharomyces bailii (strain CLIB 213 / ATCC 58445 / CBS 680 / BCRC 21525 / NBRC 1098 / NCYC 1416 / NRRL Y-2227) TaxID=1333698 RepID=A0A8J2T830_ZYGB2|nr:ZYBA0S08-00760g1_1 [Zygosaccharomyces bailii CLIB 213]
MADPTEHSINGRNNLEFTPIGGSRQNSLKRANTSFTQNAVQRSPADDEGPLRKSRRRDVDDTIASHRMFNDSSQFDDTLPQLDKIPTASSKPDGMGKGLVENLKENTTASNPLREQQEQLHKLNTDNYNLRLKCNSLLKFLHSVTDQGELTQSLKLLDEINEWKQKHNVLNQQYLELKEKLLQLEESYPPVHSEREEVQEADHEPCQRECSYLQNQLEKKNLQLNTYRDEVGHLEERLLKLQEQQAAKDEQHQLEIEMLKSDVSNLNVTLITKKSELEESKSKIQRLTNQLQEYDHRGSQSLLDLEKQLDMKRDSITSLEKEIRKLTNHRSQLETQIEEKDSETRKLKVEIQQLRNDAKSKSHDPELDELRRSKASLHEKIRQLTEEKSALNSKLSELAKERDNWKNSQQSYETSKLEHQEALNTLKQQLEDTRSELEESHSTVQQLQTQVIENTTKTSEQTSQRIKEKEYRIKELEAEVQSWRQQVRDGSLRLRAEEERSRSMFESELKKLQLNNDFERSKLEREIALLEEEKLALQDTHRREQELWKSKCDTLNKENDRLVRQEIGDMDGIQKKLSQQIEKLQENLSSKEEERSKLAEKVAKLQNSKDAYKDELKRVSSKLDFLSKEYLKVKQVSNSDDDQKTKYNTMKQRLLNELKALQEENLKLERLLLEQKGASSSQESSLRSNSFTQDRLDYYRLKYNTEVKHNNDLRIINDYLNRVLRASSQHLRLDLLKLETEVQQGTAPSKAYKAYPNNDKYGYQYQSGLKSPHAIPSFKAVALLVLSCVRMKQTAIKCRWDQQRIRYLRRKIMMDDDRISW